MENEKEKAKEKGQNNPIVEAANKAADWSKAKIAAMRKRIEKSKTIRTKDRRFSDLTDAFVVPKELREEHFSILESYK